MGLFSFLKKQFIDVIEWTEESDGVLSYRYPMQDREIQNGATLVVRETQLALFVNEGEIADLFEAGTHKLTTKTLPIMTNLQNWDKMFQSPFKSDVFFYSTREQLNQKWGTPNPITVRDKEFGAIRLRAHGAFSFKIRNPKIFFQKISGTKELCTLSDVEGQLKSLVVTSMGAFFGGSSVPFLDMAANQLKFSESLKEALMEPFSQYGLKLESFFVQSISLPEELQQFLDKKTSMAMVGDLKSYTQFQAATSLTNSGGGDGGLGAAGAGVATAMAVGQIMQKGLGGDSAPEASPVETLEKMHALLKKGVISQADFDQKKAELLKKIT